MTSWSPFRAYGQRKIKALSWPDILLLAGLACFAFWIYARASVLPAYNWNWKLLSDFIIIKTKSGAYEPGPLLSGLFVTIRIGFWTSLFAVLSGAILGAICACGRQPLVFILQIYINSIRNLPPLVFIFCVYFFTSGILPHTAIQDAVRSWPAGLNTAFTLLFASPAQIDRMISAILALGLYQGAYVAEIVRAGIQSVPKEQWDASSALGFSFYQTVLWIILPQAVRLSLPPLAGQILTIFKDSALASLISLPELTFQSLEIMAVTQLTFEIWISCALLYFLIGLICAFIARKLEQKFSYTS